MNSWVVVGGVLAATTIVSLVFWLVVMPRVAEKALSRPAALVLLAGFALLLLGIPAAGLMLLPQRTVLHICVLIVGWAAAVRGAGWVLARKYFVPRLRATQEEQDRSAAKDSPPAP